MNIPLVAIVDCETLSTEHNAALLSIGMVIRDFNTGKQVAKFYQNIFAESSLLAGLHKSDSTVKWWSQQGDAAKAVLGVNRVSLRDALKDLSRFMSEHNCQYVIGNGPRADNLWLDSAYKAIGMPCPFKFWHDLDMRTLTFIGKHVLNMGNWKDSFVGVKHNALDDAINEGNYCNEVMQRLIKLERDSL